MTHVVGACRNCGYDLDADKKIYACSRCGEGLCHRCAKSDDELCKECIEELDREVGNDARDT